MVPSVEAVDEALACRQRSRVQASELRGVPYVDADCECHALVLGGVWSRAGAAAPRIAKIIEPWMLTERANYGRQAVLSGEAYKDQCRQTLPEGLQCRSLIWRP